MSAWARLDDELDLWKAEGRVATFWWRDDDATAYTPALDRLLGIAARTGVPLALAVVPYRADPGLDAALDGRASVLQHGLAHRNHAPDGEKATELGAHRPRARVLEDIRRGHDLVARLFPRRASSILVPPWNRIADDVVPGLAPLGIRGLSTFAPRASAAPAPGLHQTNAHVDIVDWRRGRVFRGTGPVIEAALAHLAARRAGRVDAGEPTGLLTHHLVHDAECWTFVESFLRATAAHPFARWLDAAEAFAS